MFITMDKYIILKNGSPKNDDDFQLGCPKQLVKRLGSVGYNPNNISASVVSCIFWAEGHKYTGILNK